MLGFGVDVEALAAWSTGLYLGLRLASEATTGESVIRKYSGDKKSIEARSDDNGRAWSVKLFENGRLTEYSGGTLAEVDALAVKHGMKLSR